ncbi:PAS domain-containing protein [Sabulicella rubraurantiaca]|uniref:PAS domain-containing protein n=1 Tax=Sabulicella rubraurantiaca TaxID=2811429 RepID=UPI001A972B06|nr:PAS domain-containing protein [Sabulicella rubraurantiaca]
MLRAEAQIVLFWGSEYAALYNDAYAPTIGDKHPRALGQPARENWAELWDDLEPLLRGVRDTGETFSAKDRPFYIERHGGKGETVYFDISYSAVPEADGSVGGVLCIVSETTGRVLAERALRKSEEFNRRILQASADCIKVLDLGGRLEFMSEGGMCVMEVDDFSAVRGAWWPDFWRGEEHEKAVAALAEAGRGGTGRFQGFATTIKGSPRWWDVIVSAINGPDGRPEKLLSVSRDVTATKLAEEALRTSEARLREVNEMLERRVAEALAERKLLADIVEGTDAFVQVADREFRWLAINKAAADEFERIFGVRPKVGDSMLGVLAGKSEHRAAVKAVWARALAGEAFTEVGEFGDRSLARRFYEMKYDVLRGADSEPVAAYQFAYDVTARIEEQRRLAAAEAARQEADALYRAYFENTAEALFVVNVLEDGGFTVEDLNPAHQASIGLSLADVRGKRLDEILPPVLAAQVTGHYRRVLQSGEVYQYRETFELHGGPTYWDTVLVPVRDAEGRIHRLIGASRDLTAQLAAEEQLRQSQKLEAMGQLTGGVAHDFNNLLTPIIGSLDMLMRRGVGSERERRLIDGALQSAERAKTLVQRLLAFARRQPLQPTPVDLRAVVEGMAALISSTLGPQIDVRVELGPDLPPVTADQNQLEMALLNLAVNARDAMPNGGMLTIEAKREGVRGEHRAKLQRGRYVVLCVTDTGVGMDETTVKRAVEPFFSTKGVGKGTGLGLSMVHGLTAQLGGGLTIDSALGRGTTIGLWLPVSAAPLEASEADASSPQIQKGRGLALLVDDEDLVRMSTADMLIDLGFEVIEAGSAEEACRLVEGGIRPALLVTDHLMPGMSGVDLARKLRASQADLPVLIVSGYAEAEGVTPDLPRLTKPFRNAELAERIASLIL